MIHFFISSLVEGEKLNQSNNIK